MGSSGSISDCDNLCVTIGARWGGECQVGLNLGWVRGGGWDELNGDGILEAA